MDNNSQSKAGKKPASSASRQCQDLFWLALFAVFWAVAIVIGYEAFSVGDPRYLLYPTDSSGRFCGITNVDGVDYSTRPYLYFTDPFSESAPQVCLESCPQVSSFPATVSTTVCVSGSVSSDAELVQKWSTRDCSLYVYASKSILNRCIPRNVTELLAINITGITVDPIVLAKVLDSEDLASKMVGDFTRTWRWFLAFAGVALVLSFVWILLIRFQAGFFVWTVIFTVLLCVNGLAVFFYFAWQQAKTKSADGQFKSTGLQSEQDTFMGMFIAACVVAGVVDLILLFMRSRIQVAIQILREASKAIQAMPLLVFFPMWIFAGMLGLFAVWVTAELYLASARTVPSLLIATSSSNTVETFKYFQWYLLFALFWGHQFLAGINQTTIAGAVVTWYWAPDKRSLTRFPVIKSLGRVFRYSLGSIALGSLLVALIQLVRAVIFAMQRQLKKAGNQKWAQYILATCQCCCAGLEWVVKFVNRNAFILIAAHGQSFFTSSQEAFQLLTRNAFRLVTIDIVTSFILFLSRIVVVALCGVGSYYWFEYYYQDNQLYYSAPSVFIIMVEAFAVTSLFTFVYEMTVDTIFLSFCQDCEINDGSPERPYLMSPELQLLIKNSASAKMRQNRVAPGTSAVMQDAW